jgi:hypothetical protein
MTEIEKELLPKATKQAAEDAQQQSILDTARDEAQSAKRDMFAAYAELQLEFQKLHLQGWGAMGVRKLEDLVDELKSTCQSYRSAEDSVIVLLSKQDIDTNLSPANLGSPPPDKNASWDEVIGVQVVADTEGAATP